MAEAQLKSAEATVRQKQAALEQTRLDLVHTEIRAPVDGVVVSRSIDSGQTVAASLQAPTLFTIAQDLTRMQVETAVDEADVGRLREGMAATFTVDAFPGRTFRGEIAQIRKAAQVVQNVVTYTTVITVAEPRPHPHAGDDGQRACPGGPARGRAARPERGAPVPPARRRRRCARRGAAGPRRGRGPGAGAGRRGRRRPAGPAAGGAGSLGEMRTTLIRDLALTPEQQTKLDAILDEARQAFAAARDRAATTRRGGSQRRRGRAEVREKIRAILTPDQQKRFDAAAAAQGGGGAPSAPPARRVRRRDGREAAARSPSWSGCPTARSRRSCPARFKPARTSWSARPAATSARPPPARAGPALRL